MKALAQPSVPRHVIEPDSRWVPIDLAELWRFRELVYFLAWRDIRVRYKQTVLGAAWAVIQPFLTMVVFSIFLGGLAKVPSDGLPYPLFAFSALVPWTYFAYALTHGGNSLVESSNLITKVYFPRLLVPIASVVAGLPDLGIAFVVLLGMLLVYGIHPGPALLLLPAMVLLSMVTALAVVVWLSALNVLYRDFRYTIPFLVQIWLFATPVAYSSRLAPAAWAPVLGLNPMTSVIETFRWALLGAGHPPGPMLVASTATIALLLATGLVYFRRVESRFADVV